MTLNITDPFFLLQYAAVGIIFGLIFFYFFWSLIARKFLTVNVYELSVYMMTGFLVAVSTEPLHDMVYRYFFGEYLWVYQVWPIFDGASSGLAFVTWPFYGYYLYFFVQTLKLKGLSLPRWLKGSIPAADGVLFDIVANAASLLIFGIIFFYYPRPELWHLSSWWVIPFYWVSGIIYAYLLHYFLLRPKSWKIPVGCYAAGCLILIVAEWFYRSL